MSSNFRNDAKMLYNLLYFHYLAQLENLSRNKDYVLDDEPGKLVDVILLASTSFLF